MTKKKNILLITSEFPPQPGGIGNHAFHLAKGFSEAGMKVTVITDIRSESGEEEAGFDKQLPFKVIRIKRRKLIFLTYLNRILKAFKEAGSADEIWLSGKFSLWTGRWLKVFYPKRMIAVVHGSELRLTGISEKRRTESALKKMDFLVAVSHYTKNLMSQLNLKNIEVIPNGFEIKSFEKKVFTPPQSPKLITVGNVTQRKGQQNVIRALPLLLEVFPKLEYHIVGIPTEQDELEVLTRELKVEEVVYFHGRVSEERKIKLLLDSDIFVMLSEETDKGDVEGFGIAVLEANHLGLPAIGSKNSGLEDAISDGFSGEIISAWHKEELLSAVQNILKNYKAYSGQAQRWSEDFKWEKIIEQYLDLSMHTNED